MHIDAARRQRRLISLTPLIDVVFLLLVFFMLVSSFLELRSITLNTPARTTVRSGAERAVLVRLGAGGKVDLNGEALSLEALEERVRERTARNPGQRVLVQSEGTVRLQRIVAVLDRLAAAGAGDVTLSRR